MAQGDEGSYDASSCAVQDYERGHRNESWYREDELGISVSPQAAGEHDLDHKTQDAWVGNWHEDEDRYGWDHCEMVSTGSLSESLANKERRDCEMIVKKRGPSIAVTG